MASSISDYALIGDCETTALVHRNGSIDWLCWPRFDSGACLAAMLGGPENGRWLLAPAAQATRVERRYRGDTLVLETLFETDEGAVSVIDFMPIRGEESKSSDLVRIAVGRRGAVPMRMELALRFDYGRIVPWIVALDDSRRRTVAGAHATILETPVPLREENGATLSEFTLREGERVPFVLTHEGSHLPLPASVDCEAALRETERFWSEWSACNRYDGPWKDAVSRSLITIKALTYRPTGGMVAAATTSLPEHIGGVRNWDYRFCWLRDSMFMLMSLINSGYRREAEEWSDWLLRAIAGAASQIQPLYSVDGEHRHPESELPWLRGFRGSTPVRVGNAAYSQFQVDVYGCVLDTLYEAQRFGLELREAVNGLQTSLLEHLETCWHKPDEGIWEIRGTYQHFVHSKLMCWVAFDRAVRSAEQFGLEGPVERWRKLRAAIHEEVLQRGYDERRGAFVQSYGSRALDAANLLIPLVGFLPPDDPRVVSTADTVARELSRDGLLLRYDSEEVDDGLPPGEGVFLACSLWLADNYALQNRRPEAERLLERVLSLRNDVGLLSEEYDVERRELLGNFPQAYSHLALVDTALNLRSNRGIAQEADTGR